MKSLENFSTWNLWIWSAIFTQLTICTIIVDEVISAKITSTASTMLRQAHETDSTFHINKKNMRVAESIESCFV